MNNESITDIYVLGADEPGTHLDAHGASWVPGHDRQMSNRDGGETVSAAPDDEDADDDDDDEDEDDEDDFDEDEGEDEGDEEDGDEEEEEESA